MDSNSFPINGPIVHIPSEIKMGTEHPWATTTQLELKYKFSFFPWTFHMLLIYNWD